MATVRPGEKFAIPSQGAALASLNRSHSPCSPPYPASSTLAGPSLNQHSVHFLMASWPLLHTDPTSTVTQSGFPAAWAPWISKEECWENRSFQR